MRIDRGKSDLVKIIFELDPSDWHEHGTESLWALPLGNNQYQIDNIPFYIYGLSNQDVVDAREIDEELLFQRLARSGGHSTYRVFVDESADEETFSQFWKPLSDLGCSKENGGENFYAVDVPADVDIHEAYGLLETGETAGVWDFEEGKCGHELGR